jgi:Tfp pilus assembly protein PilV
MLNRLRTDEGGFGLIELVIALVVLNVGLLALVAAFNSGALALRRATQVSTASVIADRQMELYRGIKFSQIALVNAQVTTANSSTPYYGPSGGANWPSGTVVTEVTDPGACVDTTKPECKPTQTVTGPDGRTYRVDTYIVRTNYGNTQMREVKRVRVIVRDGGDLIRVLLRQETTFDEALGL